MTKVELVGETEILFTRTFKAPARIVFEAWTKPELVMQWWAPKSMGAKMHSVEADVREGGTWKYVFSGAEGPPMAFYGEYREVKPPAKLVYTSIFGMFPDAPVLVTVTFEERQGETLMLSREVYPTAEARDGALASGMEEGVHVTFAQLDALVQSLSQSSR